MPRQPTPRSSSARPADLPPTGATAAPVALDAIDRRLLALLAEDGRRSYTDLAQDVGLSAPSV
ncbi:MAG: Lrp/AsnC family transcriptional regulator, partial [Chloroflexota bacterium]